MHINQEISKIDKFSYLGSLLQGAALQVTLNSFMIAIAHVNYNPYFSMGDKYGSLLVPPQWILSDDVS